MGFNSGFKGLTT